MTNGFFGALLLSRAPLLLIFGFVVQFRALFYEAFFLKQLFLTVRGHGSHLDSGLVLGLGLRGVSGGCR